MLSRPRLHADALLNGKCQVVEIVAPAGYGKTTLLRAWHDQAANKGIKPLWVALDETTRGAVPFVRRILAALQELDENAIAIDSDVGGLDLLLGELDRLQLSCVLFVDDVQLLAGSPALQTLSWLLANQPDALSIVLSGREQSILPIQSRRLRGQLTRYTAQDLAFTHEECSRFLLESHAIQVDEGDLAQLHRRTEGWAAALQLVALALRGADDPKGFVRAFGGSNRDLTDYLAETVLSRLSEADRTFLFRICVLDRLCGDLCDSVTGESDSQRRLEEIERRNLFLIPLDAHREWFRFHSLFRGFLRARANVENRERCRADLMSAARWCLDHGHQEEAVDYSLQAGDADQAARIIADFAEELVGFRGEHQRLVEWIGRLPSAAMARHPKIAINHAWSLTFQSRFEEADKTLDQLAAAAPISSAASFHDEVRCARELNHCLALGLSDHAQAAATTALRWLEAWPKATEWQLGPVYNVLAYAHKCMGEFDAAARAVAKARENFAKAASPFGTGWAEFFNVMLQMRQGRYRAAHASCSTAMAMSAEQLGRNSLMFCMHAALLASIEYERNQLPQAREALAHGLKFLEPHGSIDSMLAAYVTLARLMASEGRLVDACDLLQEGEATGRRRAARRLTITLVAERALLLLRNGQLDTVNELLRSELVPEPEGSEYAGVVRDKRERLLVRVAIARGAAESALEPLGILIRRARNGHQVRKHVELLLIRARALLSLGRDNEALRSFSEALDLAGPERLVRVFLDEGEPLHALMATAHGDLDREAPRTASVELLEELIAAIHTERTPRALVAEPETGVMEPLTSRELQILRMIESGLSNKQLATRMFISERTLKWHLGNIYQKFDVKNRSGAIVKARRLGLLQ